MIFFRLLFQVVAGLALGLGGATLLGVGNNVELVVIALGNVVGVAGVGLLAAGRRRPDSALGIVATIFGTALGAVVGILLILNTPPTGFGQIVYPLLGALLGYYVAILSNG